MSSSLAILLFHHQLHINLVSFKRLLPAPIGVNLRDINCTYYYQLWLSLSLTWLQTTGEAGRVSACPSWSSACWLRWLATWPPASAAPSEWRMLSRPFPLLLWAPVFQVNLVHELGESFLVSNKDTLPAWAVLTWIKTFLAKFFLICFKLFLPTISHSLLHKVVLPNHASNHKHHPN